MKKGQNRPLPVFFAESQHPPTLKKNGADGFFPIKDWDTTSCVHPKNFQKIFSFLLQKDQKQANAAWFPVPDGHFFSFFHNYVIYSSKTYSRVDGSEVDPSSPSMRYTFPNMTYSKESARDVIPASWGAHSPASECPSSLSVVARTKRNLSPVIIT